MKLLTPINVGNITLKNRMVMPAMATNFGNVDGSVSQRLIEYYRARARGGVGLITVEFTAIAFNGRFTRNQLRIDHDRFVEGLSRLVDAIHKDGAHTVLQLHHSGRRSPTVVTLTRPIAPSPVPIFPGAPIPLRMTLDDIYRLRDAFIRGAVRAHKAGFDGVEVHATHGYLLAQFLSPNSNHRTDQYGGNPGNRARLPLEILKGIKEVLGSGYPVIVKMTGDEYTPGGIEIEEALVHARLFEKSGADVLCVSASAGSLMALSPEAPGTRSTSPPLSIEQACYAHLAADVKKHVSVPIMAIGRINDPTVAESLLLEAKADLVAIGRGHIADPAFAGKVKDGALDSICRCIGCLQGCIERSVHWSDSGITCTVNPKVGREAESTGIAAPRPKKVAVIGGGPAGMHAASILAERGHDVTLYEKEAHPGGKVLIASLPPGKGELLNSIRYLMHRLEHSGARVNLQSCVDVDLIRKERPDAVIVCAGAVPIKPPIPGTDISKVKNAEDVLQKKNLPEKTGKAVVMGGGLVGCETALFLAREGWQVIILEMLEDIGMDVGPIVKFYLRNELKKAGVKIQSKSHVCEIREAKVVYRRLPQGDEALLDADIVALAAGYTSDLKLFNEIRELVPETYMIGDYRHPRKILEAMRESFDIAQDI
ncbi:MAG: FAD-dependent oxidoreductase [Deltaproteobacteria bacterium]|nr:FAD-dependent oxidoreductase [Deltaproteobacteria bacterium]